MKKSFPTYIISFCFSGAQQATSSRYYQESQGYGHQYAQQHLFRIGIHTSTYCGLFSGYTDIAENIMPNQNGIGNIE
jgi:hypothetical protein